MFGPSFLDQDYTEGYYSPEQEMAALGIILGQNLLPPQQPLRAPQSNFAPTPSLPMGQPPNALTGPLSASQGLSIDPELQRRSQMMAGFQNLASLGGYQIGNPYQQQINNNLALQQARISQLRSASTNQDPLVRGVRQYAQAAGITNLPWDQQVEAYRKAKFAPESRTAAQKDTAFFRDMDPETRKAWFEREGYQVQELPDGSLQGIAKDGSVKELWNAETMQAGAEALKAAETRGAKRTEADEKFRADAITNLQQSSAEEALLQAALDTSEGFLERFQAGDLEGATGMVSGFFSQLGFGPEPLGELDAEQVRMTLANLGITNLAPVTVREIMMVNQMWAAASAGKDVNVGRLKSAIRNISRALSDLEYERNRNLKNLKRYGSEDDYNFYYDQYGTVDSIEELLGGGSQ